MTRRRSVLFCMAVASPWLACGDLIGLGSQPQEWPPEGGGPSVERRDASTPDVGAMGLPPPFEAMAPDPLDAASQPIDEEAAPYTIGADPFFAAVGFVTGILSPITTTHPVSTDWMNERTAASTLSCNGVLVAPRTVLTQATCLPRNNPLQTYFALNATGDALGHPDRTMVYAVDHVHVSPGGQAVLHLAVASDQPAPSSIAPPLFPVTANDAALSPFGLHSGAGALVDGGSILSVTVSWRVEGTNAVARRVRAGVAMRLDAGDRIQFDAGDQIQFDGATGGPFFSSDLGAPVVALDNASVLGTVEQFAPSTLTVQSTVATADGAWLEQMLWLYDEVLNPHVGLPPAPGGYSWIGVARTGPDQSYSSGQSYSLQDPEPTSFYAAGSQPDPKVARTDTLGICATWTGVAQQPGKYWPTGGCAYDSTGNEGFAAIYKVLTVTGTATWSQTTAGVIAPGTFASGYVGMTPLFACRDPYMNGLHPGFVTAGNCTITWGGQELLFSSFETLALGP